MNPLLVSTLLASFVALTVAQAGNTTEAVAPTDLASLCNGYDTDTAATQFFYIVMGALVFFMQAGFAMLEAGSTGASSVTSILFKNLADVLVGAVMWWSIGYAFAYGSTDGGNKFIGTEKFFLIDVSFCEYASWFYQFTFAATAATIVSGAMAGRTKLVAYISYSVILTGFVYPIIVFWTWSGSGWLSNGDRTVNYSDFAGSGIVHCCGGAAALIGAILVGPRPGWRDEKKEIPGHSMPLVALGTFILFFGFLGFNGGSVLANNNAADTQLQGLAVVNTIMAAAGGGLAAVALNFFINGLKHWSMMNMCNGTIAGMVAICAGADKVYPWAAFVIGIIGGITYKVWSIGLKKFGVDDAIDAAPVHLGAGIWGVISVTLFNFSDGIFYKGKEGDTYKQLGWNVLGVGVIILFTGVIMGLLFVGLKVLKQLRVKDEALEGEGGLDTEAHNEKGYAFSGKGQTTNAAFGFST